MEEWIVMRTKDELGIDINIEDLQFITKVSYSGHSDMKYGEKEIDHIYTIELKDRLVPQLNKQEVESIEWVDPKTIVKRLADPVYLFTPWFRAIHHFITNDDLQSNPLHKLGDVGRARATEAYDHVMLLPYSLYMTNTGKRIREQCCYAVQEMSNVDVVNVHKIARLVETIHAASLIHDDIEDKSILRRSVPCAHIMFGTGHALNTGTYVIVKAIEDAFDISKEIGFSAIKMIKSLHRGQNADIFWGSRSMVPTISEYLDMIAGKTGALIVFCATACGADAEVINYFHILGQFFQIRDDYCNLCDERYWKSKGFMEDLDEGKYGYPIILHMESDQVSDWFKTSRVHDKKRAYKEMYESGSLHDTEKLLIDMFTELRKFFIPRSKIMTKILDTLSFGVPPTIDYVNNYVYISFD
jgi:geranylgeranyl diphosphate synthase type 3